MLPPILLEMVEVDWWPEACFLQLELVWSGLLVVPWVQHQDKVSGGAEAGVRAGRLFRLVLVRSLERFWFLSARATAAEMAVLRLVSAAWLELW